MDLYVKCLNLKKVSLDKVLQKVPNDLKDIFKEKYYYQHYSISRKNLLKPTNDPIAIKMKKKKIKELFMIWVLRKASVCNKLPEQETREYCLSLFR